MRIEMYVFTYVMGTARTEGATKGSAIYQFDVSKIFHLSNVCRGIKYLSVHMMPRYLDHLHHKIISLIHFLNDFGALFRNFLGQPQKYGVFRCR